MKLPSNVFVLFCFVITVVFSLVWLPSFYVNADESSYYRQSDLFLNKKIFIVGLENSPGFVTGDGINFISMYPIGQSLYLMPFVALAGFLDFFPIVFLSGLFALLLGGFVFYKTLIRLKLDPRWVLLFLFFPGFVYYSKTLLADLVISILVLGAFYFYIKGKDSGGFLCGVLLGVSVLFKYPMALLFLVFWGVPLLKKEWKRASQILMGGMPFVFLLLALNLLLYGDIFATGYTLAGIGGLSDIGQFLNTFVFYLLALLLVYPLMLFAPLFYKNGGKIEIVLLTTLFLAFFSAVFWSGPSWRATDFIVKVRYLLPVLGLLLIAYVPFVEMVIKKLRINKNLAIAVLCGVLLAASMFVHVAQSDYANSRVEIRDFVRSNAEPNSLIVGSADNYLYAEGRKYLDINDINTATNHLDYFLTIQYAGYSDYGDKTTLARMEEMNKVISWISFYGATPIDNMLNMHNTTIWKVD